MRKMKKPYWEMNADELAKATAEFDREAVETPGRPLTAAQRARHERARRPGRPLVGQGSERINVTIERGLLGAADKLAKANGWSRAQLIAMGLRQAIATQAGVKAGTRAKKGNKSAFRGTRKATA